MAGGVVAELPPAPIHRCIHAEVDLGLRTRWSRTINNNGLVHTACEEIRRIDETKPTFEHLQDFSKPVEVCVPLDCVLNGYT